MPVNVVMSGPIFSAGTTDAALEVFLAQARSDVAQETVNQVQNRLGAVLKHPTGYYKSHIRATNLAETSRVDDSGVIYGPWLEGVGSRNHSTRFKGYHTFRQIFPRINAQANEIAEKHVPELIGKLS